MKRSNRNDRRNKSETVLPTAYWLLPTIFLTLFLFSINSNGQAITRVEYFFDTDPGAGNGVAITFTPTAGDVSFTTNIPTTLLSQGFHFLGIRAKETGGVWSIFESRGFYITATTADAPNISAAEYFFDADPGNGNGTAIAITPGATTNFTVALPTASLSPGFHFLAIRTKGLGGRWGVFEARGFYITASTTDVPNIVAAEYFFDADPGNGNGTAIPITAGATTNFTVALPTAGLQPGFHFLAVRTKGVDDKWGIFESRGFYVTGSTTDVPNIIAAEYFFDTDPGNGNGISIPITAGATSNFTATIPITGLTPGFHFLAVRTKGGDGQWGIFESRGFYVSPINTTVGDIVAAEYFIDTDPGEGNGLPATVNPTGPTINQIFPIAIIGITSGPHKLGMRVKDADGIWSAVQMENFDVLICTAPSAPTVPAVSRCNSGTVTLTATSGATGSQVYKWYADATVATSLFTGASFVTPSISANTDYFVTVFDPATLCESARTKVSAIINSTSKPTLNATGNITLCESNSFLLSAPAGFSTYTWSNGMATQQILVTINGNYSVTVGNGTCTSLVSDATTFTFSPKPAKPVLQASGPTNLCSGGSVTLSAPTGFTYLWSTGANTEQIIVNASGNYTVRVVDGSNCPSDLSDPMIVTVSAPPAKPVIEIFGSTSLCGTTTVALLAPSGFAVYQWSGGQTTQGITVSTAGSHTVRVGNSVNCLSPASDAVAVTSTNQPCTGSGTPNSPPNIASAPLAIIIEGKLIFDLTTILSDPDNNIDFTSLRVVGNTTSRGASASVSSSFELTVDYNGMPFTGIDRITIEVCDLSGACAQRVINIDVVGDVEVFNGLTPDGDGLNDFMIIKYVDVVENAAQNKVTIYNRWGDVVFDIDNYDNLSRVFAGETNSGKELPTGTYFYKIDFSNGKSITGFISLKR